MTTRGQTTQDFAVGVSVFLLTVAFLFAFLPSVLTPFEAGPTASESAQAGRVGTAVHTNITIDGYGNELDRDAAATFFGPTPTGDELRTRLSLPTSARLNVTVRNENDSIVALSESGIELRGGEQYAGQPAARATRLVRADAETYRLEVRVW
ncbi:hypothetical protein C440_13884 [Haloferax mucosum ATCC BAA-1512]|uniref:Uncharacterized protein n=1 Tax=Haloferax mucosum ATCC BAA-1512 TaxID=662479 RepID=M0I7I8_9EURY|nr:hypothetical protein [Haloferax mucosum]ELZ91409.1 hypothetical protein C440_13884 [Haloferax mucosum ATCC BAA-1512]